VRIRPTIPFTSPTLEVHGATHAKDLNINIDFPLNRSTACAAKGAANHCEIKISAITYYERHKFQIQSEWYKEATMTVYNKDDVGYRIDNSIILRLKTRHGDDEPSTAASVYEDVSLPDIMVNNKETLILFCNF
jgi:hypothetical protein